MTLPGSSSARAGQPLDSRLAQFRDELRALGATPARSTLESMILRANELGLRDEQIGEDLYQIRASIETMDLQARIARGEMPTVLAPDPLPAGDACHFLCPTRFGRRRSDQFGHLVLTSGWLKFRAALDVSVAWSEVESVRRDGREIVISLHGSRRILLFACHSVTEAVRGSVIAEHLAHAAQPDPEPARSEYHASV